MKHPFSARQVERAARDTADHVEGIVGGCSAKDVVALIASVEAIALDSLDKAGPSPPASLSAYAWRQDALRHVAMAEQLRAHLRTMRLDPAV